MNRVIVIILDSFGIGAMEDVKNNRQEDINANTCQSILNHHFNFPTLNKLGLLNLLDQKLSVKAAYGKSALKHFGADSYAGHQEIMGTYPKAPVCAPLSTYLKELIKNLKELYTTELICMNEVNAILVNNAVLIADNMETDLGQVINVSGLLDIIDFQEVLKIANIVRKNVQVSRVIALGGINVSLEQLKNAIFTKSGFIGLNTPKSGLYLKGYQVVHIGLGVNTKVQLPNVLYNSNISSYFYGKVADIVYNNSGFNYPGVDTKYVFNCLKKDLQKNEVGFYCLNIQETDLAGHSQDVIKYGEILNICDTEINEILKIIDEDDLLIIMADHGNDPCIGHNQHTREYVPILIKYKKIKNIELKTQKSLASVGATVAEYFGCELEYGDSFLKKIKL